MTHDPDFPYHIAIPREGLEHLMAGALCMIGESGFESFCVIVAELDKEVAKVFKKALICNAECQKEEHSGATLCDSQVDIDLIELLGQFSLQLSSLEVR